MPSSAVGVHSTVSDDQNDTVVVWIVLSKDEILRLFASKKLHFQLEVGTSVDSRRRSMKRGPLLMRRWSGLGWSWMGARLPAGQKAEILVGAPGIDCDPTARGSRRRGGG